MSIYGEYEWMQRCGGGTIEIRTRQMAKAMHLKAATIRNLFRWCEQFNYISNLEFGYGYVRYTINKPKLLMKEWGYE